MNEASTSINGILNHRVQLEQPVDGFRVAVDTVLLAAAVPASSGEKILDLGCGVGGAMLCVARRIENISGLGIDIQSDLVEMCGRNIERNKEFASGLSVKLINVTDLPTNLHGSYDHALMNPPYHDEKAHSVSSNESKRVANSESDEGDLGFWIYSAALALKHGGSLSIIHRADRRDEIVSILLDFAFGDIDLFPIAPMLGRDPKRIIVRARKKAAPEYVERCPLILHKSDGGYTDEADELLRNAQGLDELDQYSEG